MMVGTQAASNYTGLSEYELRRGYKEGRYPALEIGGGRLRWNLEELEAAIRKQMRKRLRLED